MTDQHQPSPLSPLTERQRQVVELAAEGLVNAGIADRLGLSEATVKVHIKAAFRALGIARRSQLVSLVGATPGAVAQAAMAASAASAEVALPEGMLRIAALIAEGRTNDEIAAALGRSPATVKAAVRDIIDRLGLVNRVQVANWFLRRSGRVKGAANENAPTIGELAAPGGPGARDIAVRLGMTPLDVADRLLEIIRSGEARGAA